MLQCQDALIKLNRLLWQLLGISSIVKFAILTIHVKIACTFLFFNNASAALAQKNLSYLMMHSIAKAIDLPNKSKKN